MKKIISLFQRDHEGNGLIIDKYIQQATWVLTRPVIATLKFDGTSCLIKDNKLYKRYDVKHGKQPPVNFIPAQAPDPITGHWPGWILVDENNPADKWHIEAWQDLLSETKKSADINWTYELCGPKIQNNAEGFDRHILIKHGFKILHNVPRDFEGLKEYFTENIIEGIVWWSNLADQDCEKVKIKRKDFGLKWPVK